MAVSLSTVRTSWVNMVTLMRSTLHPALALPQTEGPSTHERGFSRIFDVTASPRTAQLCRAARGVEFALRMPRTCATEHSTLISGTHGRDRREERGIEKIDLQRARRYGMKEAAHHGREKYTYGGIVFIYDPWRKREVTSFPAPDASLATSGTKVVQPVLLDKQAQYELPAAVDCHRVQHASMAANPLPGRPTRCSSSTCPGACGGTTSTARAAGRTGYGWRSRGTM